MQRSILHLDMDAFYASVEQHDDPALRGRPVVVGSEARRGVVAAASYEARRYGVRSAMPGITARRLCPEAVFIAPRMERYGEVSSRVFAIMGRVTPVIEALSLDEAFLDVGASLRLFGDALAIGQRLKHDVLAETGLRCSVGVSHNKLLAKLATELGKPDGLFEITPANVRATLDPLPVGRLWTVGKVAEAKLAEIGVGTIGALRTTPPAKLEKLFGSHAGELVRLASGIDEREVVPDREEKSIGAENTFEQDLRALADARHWLMRLVERVGERTRRHGLAGRTVTLKLRVPPFETMTRQSSLERNTDATAEIFAVADALLATWWRERGSPALRLLGVTLSGFELRDDAQHDLFAPVRPAQQEGHDRLLDRINEKFGPQAIRRATGLDEPEG